MTTESQSFARRVSSFCAQLGLATAIVVNVFSLLISIMPLFAPHGAGVWPMHLGGVYFLSILAVVTVVPCGIVGLCGPLRLRAALALVLLLPPIPMAIFLWQVISAAKGFDSFH